MARWLQTTIQAWVDEREIRELDVVVELPFLRSKEEGSNVVTLMSQVRLITAYEDALMRIENCAVRLGEVSNTTAKAIFTGSGTASKDIMVTFSAWSHRPDVNERKDLADAQAIGTCYPSMIRMNPEELMPLHALYVDNAIGEGPHWQKRRH